MALQVELKCTSCGGGGYGEADPIQLGDSGLCPECNKAQAKAEKDEFLRQRAELSIPERLALLESETYDNALFLKEISVRLLMLG